MADSPQVTIKRASRLSFRKRRQTDSPKTPVRWTAESPDFFNTSNPSPDTCGTPLNRKKRTFFGEESPSQDYDAYPMSFILSQEVQNIVDVGWKWEENTTTEKKVARPAKVVPVRRVQSENPKPSKNVKKSPDSQQKKGYYKFKEELLSAVNDPSTIFSQYNDQSKSKSDTKEKIVESTNENVFNNEQSKSHSDSKEKSIESYDKYFDVTFDLNTTKQEENINKKDADKLHLNNQSSKERVSLRMSTDNMLEDSDLDNLLLQCSQQAEANYEQKMQEDKIINKKQLDNLKKNDVIEQDSLDDLLLSLPVEENDILNENFGNTSNISCKLATSSLQNKVGFSRYNSMPVSPQADSIKKRPSTILVRHNSMPTKDEQNKIPYTGGSSNESIPSDSQKKRCTAEEIKRKRLEAIQRLQARKQKTSLPVKNVMNIKSNLINSKSGNYKL